MVLLKRILENVAALIAQSASHNGGHGAFPFQDGQNGVNGVHPNGEEHNPFQPDTGTSSIAEIDAVRSHEITAKAVSGILILLLKWFKVSRMCPPWSIFLIRLLNINRYPQIRISYAITRRRQLYPFDTQTTSNSRSRTYRQLQMRPSGPEVCANNPTSHPEANLNITVSSFCAEPILV